MSTWTDRIRNHEVWKELEALGPAIDKADSRWTTDAQSREGLQRIRAVLALCGKRLAATDPDLIEPRPLANLARALLGARSELEAFVTDQNAAHVAGANTQCDEILAALPAVLTPTVPDDLTAISESAASYRALLERFMSEASASQAVAGALAGTHKTRLDELSAELAMEKQKLSTLVADFQTQFTAGQTTRATEFTTAQTERQTKAATVISEIQTAFSSAQDARANEFTKAQTDRHEKFTTATSEFQSLFSTAQDTRATEYADAQSQRDQAFKTLLAEQTKTLADQSAQLASLNETAAKAYEATREELRSHFEVAAVQALKQIETHRKQVEKLVGVIGNLGVTSGYQKIANRAQMAVYIWQFLTVAALGGLVFVAYIIAFTPPAGESLFIQGLSTRIFLSAAIGVFAAYAARQAKLNFDIERRNRKLALELEALGPFISPLPEEMQHEFRKQIGDRSFGVPEGVAGKPDGPDPVSTADLLKMVHEMVSELIKKGGT